MFSTRRLRERLGGQINSKRITGGIFLKSQCRGRTRTMRVFFFFLLIRPRPRLDGQPAWGHHRYGVDMKRAS